MFHGDRPQGNLIEGFESSDSESGGLDFGDNGSDGRNVQQQRRT